MIGQANKIRISDVSVIDWNNIVNEIFVPMDVQPIDANLYRAAITVESLGSLSLAAVTADAEIVHHPANHATRQLKRKLFLHLQLQGRMALSLEDGQVWLEPGDIGLSDSVTPYTLEHHDRCSLLVVTIPFEQMKRYLPDPDQIVGCRLPGDAGFCRTMSAMLRSLAGQIEHGFAAEIADRAGRHVMEMLATSWLSMAGVTVADSWAAASRRTHICRYIEANLREPDLTTQRVATAFRISTRYLQMVFAERGESVSGYILRRRLEECARHFVDPLWNKRTITEIAFGWGFNNATHFARVFRNTYHMSPRDYRHQCRNEHLACLLPRC